MHRQELNQIMGSIAEKGLSCVPLKVYFKKGRAKVELGLAKGKPEHDKRQSLREKEANREITRELRARTMRG